MAWVYNNDKSTQGANTNLFKDWWDSTAAGLTNQTPAWKIAADAKAMRDAADKPPVAREEQRGNANTQQDAQLSYSAPQAKIGDAATIGAYEQQIADLERSLGLLPGQLEAGLNQLNDGLNKGKSRLNEQHSLALTRSTAQRNDTKADFQDSLTDNDTQARGNYQAMMALLGRAGAGSSSAASVVTPYAVSNEASKTRGKVADTYGRNVRDLDLADEETKLSYENNIKDLEDQRRTQEYSLRQGVESQKAKTLGAIAEAEGNRELAKGKNWATAKDAMSSSLAKKNAIEAALSTMLNSYRNPYTVKDVAVKTAKLNNYAVDPNGIKIDDPNGTGLETDTAALTAAQIKEQEELKKKTV